MALRTAENVSKITTEGVPPNFKGTVIARFIKQKFGPSKSSGNPMISLEAEVIAPSEIVDPMTGNKFDPRGQKLNYYLVLAERTAEGKPWDSLQYITTQLLPTLGLGNSVDDEKPLKSDDNPSGLNFEGIVFEAVVSTEERKEAAKQADGTYAPIKDSLGNEISRGWTWRNDMKGILRLATNTGSMAY